MLWKEVLDHDEVVFALSENMGKETMEKPLHQFVLTCSRSVKFCLSDDR